MILYIDISALVKRYIREACSDDVIKITEQSEGVGSSVLTHVEMAATFAKAVRLGWVEDKMPHMRGRIISTTGPLSHVSSFQLAWWNVLQNWHGNMDCAATMPCTLLRL